MTKEERRLKVYYELRNHIGALALNDEDSDCNYVELYKWFTTVMNVSKEVR